MAAEKEQSESEATSGDVANQPESGPTELRSNRVITKPKWMLLNKLKIIEGQFL